MIRWHGKWTGLALAAALIFGAAAPSSAKDSDRKKLDKTLSDRAGKSGTSRVIIRLKPGSDASSEVKKLGGKLGRKLGSINGQVIELPNGQSSQAGGAFGDSEHAPRPADRR